jgi:rSAM/selenodomain-associated transferase 1
MTKELLLIFVKHPIPGQVKTRLAATMGNEGAVAIYQQLLAYSCEISKEITADKAVFYGNQIPETDLWKKAGYQRFLQEGEDLGARMLQAFVWGFDQGYERILIMGSDCPHLDAAHLEQAFLQLQTHDAVLGPAKDGGYYALGLRKLFPDLFLQKEWSTQSVFTSTLNDLMRSEKSFYLLPTLSDVDHEEDLKGTFLES